MVISLSTFERLITPTGTTGDTDTDTGGDGNCGDGLLDADEQCDDGPDNADTNSCTSECKNNIYGDGKVGPGVGCDHDGNAVDDDECNNTCALSTCGDGEVAPTEECDDGNPDDTDMCTAACTAATCSDGFIQPSADETCDDRLCVVMREHAACDGAQALLAGAAEIRERSADHLDAVELSTGLDLAGRGQPRSIGKILN